MGLPNKKHIDFFDHQLNEMEQERLAYIRTPVNSLWKEGRLFVGRIWGYDNIKGQLILRFKKGRLPRLKVPYQLCHVGSSAGDDHMKWSFSYGNFRDQHCPINSRIYPIYFMPPEGDWRYQGCSQLSLEFLNAISADLLAGKHPLVIVAEEDPPYRYLENLKGFVKRYPRNEILNIEVDLNSTTWSPTRLPKHEFLSDHVLEIMAPQPVTLIQGPPGTGKTHLVADISHRYLNDGKSVCITALTNRALVEIAQKEPLSGFLQCGAITKTNLTTDEAKKLPGLKPSKDRTAIPGHLILGTYFLMSDELTEIDSKRKKYDLLIIEEASQAFLATIAAFCELGKKVLIVGDPMQLFPIVKEREKCGTIHPQIDLAIRGMETFAFSHEDISHRITDTFRLSSRASEQTGVFYDGQLQSVSPLNGKTLVQSNYEALLCSDGGTSMVKFPFTSLPEECIQLAVKVAVDIWSRNPGFEIAILSNLKVTVEKIYDLLFETIGTIDRFEVETIDRIQGLTCDLSVVVLESKIHFGLQKNRFNVATSRAKRGTLIVTRKSIDSLKGIEGGVSQFLDVIKTTEF